MHWPDGAHGSRRLCRGREGLRLLSPPMEPRVSQPRALVVEDDSEMAHALGDLVEREGFDVTCASTLAAAREEIAATVPDILLVDIHLPDGSGLDLLEGLGPADPEVVLITGQA